MFVSFSSTMLKYYCELYGLPYMAKSCGKNVLGGTIPCGFIFDDGNTDVTGLFRVSDIQSMLGMCYQYKED